MNIATAIEITERRMKDYMETQEDLKSNKEIVANLENDICACKIGIRCMLLIERTKYDMR